MAALRHRRRFALMEADEVLASAERYDLTGRLDRQLVTMRAPMTLARGGEDPSTPSPIRRARLLECRRGSVIKGRELSRSHAHSK
jgi:hypothetical protein